MDPNETYVRNCYISMRPSDKGPLFASSDEHGVQCCLDGYVVIPLERYHTLLNQIAGAVSDARVFVTSATKLERSK